jgi:hypothetical protein
LIVFEGVLKTPARIMAFRPRFDRSYQSVVIEAKVAGGRRLTLLKLHSAQPQWYRRYWLREPLELPAGADIEVTAIPLQPTSSRRQS